MTPNFWRAPTDNDFGAGLQQKYARFRNLRSQFGLIGAVLASSVNPPDFPAVLVFPQEGEFSVPNGGFFLE